MMDVEHNYPGVATEEVKSMINWGQSQQAEKKASIVTDPTVHGDLLSRTFSADNPTTDVQILEASAAGKLDAHDTSSLLALNKAVEERPLKGPLYQTALEGAKERLGVGLMADGHQRFANAMQAFIPEYLKRVREGKSEPNDLNLNDDKSFIRKSIGQFEPTARQRQDAYIYKNLGGGGVTAAEPTVAGPPHVTTQAEFDALPKGAQYIGTDGKPYRKP